MKPVIIIPAILLLVAGGVIGLRLFQSENSAEPTQNQTKNQRSAQKAPGFSLEDYNGNLTQLSDFEGKNIIVNSWAVWCPFCVKELKDFVKLQQEFEEDIIIIAIDRAESLNTAKSYTDDIGASDALVFLLDPGDSFYRSIGGFSMPETIFVNKEGNTVFHKRGPMTLAEMRQKVGEVF